jgi:hypothetical protein
VLPDTPVVCPAWEYTDVPNHETILAHRTYQALARLQSLSPASLAGRIKDTRGLHDAYFNGLTPPTTPYYAGHYRGEDYTCLRHCSVQISSDPRVGHPPEIVMRNMSVLAADISHALQECDVAWLVPHAVVSRPEKLVKVVSVATAIFVYFLEIHPYANGNGHAARFILIATLARHGLYLRRWHMHPRPQEPTYSDAIKLYRDGDRGPLERFVLSCL